MSNDIRVGPIIIFINLCRWTGCLIHLRINDTIKAFCNYTVLRSRILLHSRRRLPNYSSFFIPPFQFFFFYFSSIQILCCSSEMFRVIIERQLLMACIEYLFCTTNKFISTKPIIYLHDVSRSLMKLFLKLC